MTVNTSSPSQIHANRSLPRSAERRFSLPLSRRFPRIPNDPFNTNPAISNRNLHFYNETLGWIVHEKEFLLALACRDVTALTFVSAVLLAN